MDAQEPWRYNFFIANNYFRNATNVASRFWDIDQKCDFALLASVWHSKNDFGRKLDPVFSVQNIYEASKKPNFEVGEIARVIHATYLGYLADIERRKTDPIVVIQPPPPEPPKELPKQKSDPWAAHPNMPQKPEPKPSLPEVKLPQEPKEKKPRPEWVIKLGVWMSILTPVSLVILYFVPPPYNMIAKAVFEAIKLLIGG